MGQMRPLLIEWAVDGGGMRTGRQGDRESLRQGDDSAGDLEKKLSESKKAENWERLPLAVVDGCLQWLTVVC